MTTLWEIMTHRKSIFVSCEGLLWNRNSKHTAEQAIPVREAVRKLLKNLKFLKLFQ